MKILIFALIGIMVNFYSCNNKENKKTNVNEYYLRCVYHSSNYKNPIYAKIYDSSGYINFSYTCIRNTKVLERIKKFRWVNDGYYEFRENNHFTDSKLDSIFILAFYIKDTTFSFKFDYNKYEYTLPRGWDDWKYTIKVLDSKNFSLIKNHLFDSTFKEEYYYDKFYKIKRINLFYGSDTLIFEK